MAPVSNCPVPARRSLFSSITTSEPPHTPLQTHTHAHGVWAHGDACVCSERCAFPRSLLRYILNFSRSFEFRVTLIPHVGLRSRRVACDSLSHLLLFCQTRGNACLTFWSGSLNYIRCVWFTSADILQASELGQHLHSLPCPSVLFSVLFFSSMQNLPQADI